MTIVITGSQIGSSTAIPPFTLADGILESPADFRIHTARDIQIVKYLRGKNAKAKDRGNRIVTVSFKVTRLFDNVGDAEKYILMHETTLPGGGTVTMTASDNSFSCQIADAAIESTESSYMGATTFHTYQITGGIIDVSP